jgi:hypothetical protein
LNGLGFAIMVYVLRNFKVLISFTEWDHIKVDNFVWNYLQSLHGWCESDFFVCLKCDHEFCSVDSPWPQRCLFNLESFVGNFISFLSSFTRIIVRFHCRIYFKKCSLKFIVVLLLVLW